VPIDFKKVKKLNKNLFIVLFLLVFPAVAQAQDFNLPTAPGKTSTDVTLSEMSHGTSYYSNFSDPKDILVNIGVDESTILKTVRSDALSDGDTDDDARQLAVLATKQPIFYSDFLLQKRAKVLWADLEKNGDVAGKMEFKLIIRTSEPDGSLQPHLVESFTCTLETKKLCLESEFEKLPDYTLTPWFMEYIDQYRKEDSLKN
jgi:hypothetical protein